MDLLRKRGGGRTAQLVGHILDEPQVITVEDTKYMVFHLGEAAGTEFRLKMLPTTSKRHKGDRVEITWTPNGDGPALVESLYSAPDAARIRRRNEEYLANVQSQETGRNR